jgi:hypothetical protein
MQNKLSPNFCEYRRLRFLGYSWVTWLHQLFFVIQVAVEGILVNLNIDIFIVHLE